MHTATVKLKNGDVHEGAIWEFNPKEGYLTLIEGYNNSLKLYFKDMISAIAKGERVSINKIADIDEMERARQYLKDARKYGWGGITANFPKQEWE